jgi:hypothetical protein
MFPMEFRILGRVSVHYLLDSTYSVTHSQMLKVELVNWTLEDILGIRSEGYKRCLLHYHFHLKKLVDALGCQDALHTLFCLFHEDSYKSSVRGRTRCLVHNGIQTL